MLTVLTVDSLGDDIAVDGKVTLREAIQAANTDAQVGDAVAGNGADLIQFHASLVPSSTTKPPTAENTNLRAGSPKLRDCLPAPLEDDR